MGSQQAPIIVLNQNVKREQGKKVQIENINAGKRIAEVVRTCLGPRAMLKMLMDPMGGICLTNDGNAILREITVQHPAAKSLIEIARTQDEEVGDGTTSVIVLAGETLALAQPFLSQQMHPTVIIRAYRQALEDMINLLRDEISITIDLKDDKQVREVIKACIGTKFMSQWSDLAVDIAQNAVNTVFIEENGRKEIDIKRYAKVEKIPGGRIEDSYVLKGIMLNKDVTHQKMRRRIEKPRVILLDCPLEYKKGESMTNVELFKEEDFTKMLQQEEEFVHKLCEDIIKFKPDVIFTEKGVSDLAQHFLVKAGITAIRRVKKSDNNRLSRATGAVIVSRTDEMREEDVGTKCGLFEVKKIGDEYFTFVSECEDPKACTIVLRGASRDILKEVERNLQDAMCVARNIYLEAKVVGGGGAVEMAVSHALTEKSKSMTGVEQWPYRAVVQALEVIPRTLAQNCGANVIRTLTTLRAKHAAGGKTWGIDGESGEIVDMNELKIWEPLSVKLQTYKTAIETAILLLRIDDIVSGSKKKDGSGAGGAAQAPTDQSMQE